MKYFTPELFLRGNSPDENTVQGVEEAWERAVGQYHRRLRKIGVGFPKGWHEFRGQHIRLHDAQVLSIAQEAGAFVFVVQPECRPQTIVLLTFTLDGEPSIDRAALPGRESRAAVTWLYEEFDIDRGGRCRFEVLLSNGWDVMLYFRDLHFVQGRAILPAGNGHAPHAAATVSQSA
jgi:hypothetical protein